MKQYDKLAYRKAEQHRTRRFWDLEMTLFYLAGLYHEKRTGNPSYTEKDKVIRKHMIMLRTTLKAEQRKAGKQINHRQIGYTVVKSILVYHFLNLGVPTHTGVDEFGVPTITAGGYAVTDVTSLDAPLANTALADFLSTA